MDFETKFAKKYNKLMDRLDKADEFLMKFGGKVEFVHFNGRKFTLDMVQKMYNDLIIEISHMQQEYKEHYGVEMDLEDKWNGIGRK